ncbi:hypothetical protein AJ79_04492 [Helicocarpus griseus UAMH5409]|uniref:Zn(2)-C6 fungal-type domain-containing protein n=1 Tax=Helicocarpus griseus UAMH5409 TaxID=1447875 RepID=A0A2B7XTI8_9EURO|nr:hypothetical protein AJ79_04492 [Helicocarpus griseus UAMH5409]
MDLSPTHGNKVGKRRTSCDRCHTLKSKCTKITGSERCSRCERVGIPCIFSDLPMRNRRTKSLQIPNSPTRRHGYDKLLENSNLDAPYIAQICTCGLSQAGYASSITGNDATPLSAPGDVQYRWSGQNTTPPGSPSPPFRSATELHHPIIYQTRLSFNSQSFQEPSTPRSFPTDLSMHATDGESEGPLNMPGAGSFPAQIKQAEFDRAPFLSSSIPAWTPDFSNCSPHNDSPDDRKFDDDMNSRKFKLSNLHSRLYSIFSTSTDSSDTVHPEDLLSSASDPITPIANAPTKDIDEIFLLTQTLIELIQESYHQNTNTTVYHSHNRHPNVPQLGRRASTASQENYKCQQQHQQQHDPGAILLTLTCYLRLLDIYELLVVPLYQFFKQRHQEFAVHPNTPFPLPFPLPLSHIPSFKLGRYGITATSSLNLGLLLHLLLRTLECLHNNVSLYLPTTPLSPRNRWAYTSSDTILTTMKSTPTSNYAEADYMLPRQNGASTSRAATGGHVMLLAESALSEAGKREKYLMEMLYSATETSQL